MSSAPTAIRRSTFLPILASIVFIGGMTGALVLGFFWPIPRSLGVMDLSVVVTEPAADGTVFNVPLFLLVAGPVLITTAVLLGCAEIVNEMRMNRASVAQVTRVD